MYSVAAPSPRPGHSRHSAYSTPVDAAVRSARTPRASPRQRRRSGAANSPGSTAAPPRASDGFYWLERPPRPVRPVPSTPRRTGGGGQISDSSYSSKHTHKSRYESSRMSAELLAEAAKLEAEAWSLREQDQAAIAEGLEKTMLYWTQKVDRQTVQAENHRLAEKVVTLTDALAKERAHAAKEIERVRAQLQQAEDDARIARVAARLHQRDGSYDAEDASRSLLWR